MSGSQSTFCMCGTRKRGDRRAARWCSRRAAPSSPSSPGPLHAAAAGPVLDRPRSGRGASTRPRRACADSRSVLPPAGHGHDQRDRLGRKATAPSAPVAASSSDGQAARDQLVSFLHLLLAADYSHLPARIARPHCSTFPLRSGRRRRRRRHHGPRHRAGARARRRAHAAVRRAARRGAEGQGIDRQTPSASSPRKAACSRRDVDATLGAHRGRRRARGASRPATWWSRRSSRTSARSRSCSRSSKAIVAEGCILASNTSSLSVTAMAAACKRPERVAGYHFFNPVPVMKIVEVVDGVLTEPWATDALTALAQALRPQAGALQGHARLRRQPRRPRASSRSRCACCSEGVADFATIDRILVDAAGFRIGPVRPDGPGRPRRRATR